MGLFRWSQGTGEGWKSRGQRAKEERLERCVLTKRAEGRLKSKLTYRTEGTDKLARSCYRMSSQHPLGVVTETEIGRVGQAGQGNGWSTCAGGPCGDGWECKCRYLEFRTG